MKMSLEIVDDGKILNCVACGEPLPRTKNDRYQEIHEKYFTEKNDLFQILAYDYGTHPQCEKRAEEIKAKWALDEAKESRRKDDEEKLNQWWNGNDLPHDFSKRSFEKSQATEQNAKSFN